MKKPIVGLNVVKEISKTLMIIFGVLALIFSLTLFNKSSERNIALTIVFGILFILSITAYFTIGGYIKQNLGSMSQEESSSYELQITKFNAKYDGASAKVLSYVFLTLCAVFSFLPFYWMIISSLKTEMEYRQSVPTFFPQTIQWANYSTVLTQTDSSNGSFLQILINTLVVGLVSTSLGVVVTIISAYAFARMKFKGKNILFTIMLGTMMIPGEMFTITNYITVAKLQWNNTFTVMILPFLVSIYYIFLLRNNFMQIPESLYKAAKVDGLSDMGYLIKVMVPLTAPTLVSVTLLKFIGTWNSYIWPRLVNSPKWQLVTNWVSRGFVDKGGLLYNGFYGSSLALTTLKMAAVCMVSLPLFLLFVFFRKYIMKGVSKSGTKG